MTQITTLSTERDDVKNRNMSIKDGIQHPN